MNGILYLVGTPIGNLEDITLRALRALKEADLIACEDTRITSRLLVRYQIQKPLISYFEHNEEYRAGQLVRHLLSGKNVALVSNAGSPLISDPGYELVRLCIAQGIRIIAVPGPAALVAALSVSGLPTDSFVFEGFLPLKPSKRKKRIERLLNEERTIIIYESPHRIYKTLAGLYEILGNRLATVCREMTKLHEEIKHGSLSELMEWSKGKKIRGEITLVLAGSRPGPVNSGSGRLPPY